MAEINPADCIILNVDDYVPGRYARTKVLQQAGYRVVEAGTGQQTFEAIELYEPDLILLDVNLPDMSGFEVCRRIRENPQGSAVTILHISASSVHSQHQINGLDSGADAYLVEPIEPPLLLATLRAFLRARRAEDEMRRSIEELRWFAHRVGHDLNEPLRTMTAHSQLLQRQLHDRPENALALDFIIQGAAKMRLFLDGLLQYSLASTDKPNVQELDTGKIIRRVIESLDTAIRESGASVTCDKLPRIVGSPQLEQAFQNLISNAIKYRKPEVAPEIHISARPEMTAWVFSVADNGVGIAREHREQVFQVFRRLHGQDIPGSGIGLAVVRKIAEAHGGEVWVESEEGRGSVFNIRLPRLVPQTETESETPKAGVSRP
jgi:signal transduction histidine kinase